MSVVWTIAAIFGLLSAGWLVLFAYALGVIHAERRIESAREDSLDRHNEDAVRLVRGSES